MSAKENGSESTATLLSRRRLLQAGAASVVVVFANDIRVASAALPQLSMDDATAKALGYVHNANTLDSSVRGGDRVCNNCRFFPETSEEWGPCNLFPGKAVNSNGWCRGWVKRG